MAHSHEIHPVDLHLGRRLRDLRLARGLTQAALGEKVGQSFQSIQHYETAANRVTASRLADLAKALDVGVFYFFEGLPCGRPTRIEDLDENARGGLRVLAQYRLLDPRLQAVARKTVAILSESQAIKERIRREGTP